MSDSDEKEQLELAARTGKYSKFKKTRSDSDSSDSEVEVTKKRKSETVDEELEDSDDDEINNDEDDEDNENAVFSQDSDGQSDGNGHEHDSEAEESENNGNSDQESIDYDTDDDENRKALLPEALLPHNLEKFEAKIAQTGVCYMSRIPPFMKHTKLRSMLSKYGTILRIYLNPEDPKISARRKKYKKNRRVNYTEGWIEFEGIIC